MKRLCHYVKSSSRRDNDLELLFDRLPAAFSQSFEKFDSPSLATQKFQTKNSLRDLITDQRVFSLQSGASEQEDLFNHPERRELAAKLALNLLIFYAWRHTSRPWDGNGIYFFLALLRKTTTGNPHKYRAYLDMTRQVNFRRLMTTHPYSAIPQPQGSQKTGTSPNVDQLIA
jgi:hypothetical protein